MFPWPSFHVKLVNLLSFFGAVLQTDDIFWPFLGSCTHIKKYAKKVWKRFGFHSSRPFTYVDYFRNEDQKFAGFQRL